MFQKYRSLPKEEREKGVGAIYILGLISINLLMLLMAVFATTSYIHNMIAQLHDAVETAGYQALNQAVLPDIQGNQVAVDQNDAQQVYETLLPKYLSKWPQSSYSVQSFQVFTESDRGKPAPPGFIGIIPGTSAFITMNLQLTLLPGILPASHSTWIFPVRDAITPNTFHNPNGQWNPARQ